MTKSIEDFHSDFEANLARVENLTEVYSNLAGNGQGRRPVHSTDLLRAATVLLHAALEDFLRSVEKITLPKCTESALSDIPLAGSERTQKKFSLGQLSKHRAKTVGQVLQESVAEHLEIRSYNSTTEIVTRLQRIGVDRTKLEALLPALDEMISRRHHIVHQADRNDTPGQGHHKTKSISLHAVTKWLRTVSSFATELKEQVQR